jgi:RHS repeat-associated protein
VPATSGFLTADGATSGSGGTITYSYPANSGAQRAANVTVGDQTVTVTQLAHDQTPTDDVVVYYHTDAIGSVRLVTDANGAAVRAHDFLPFGQDTPAGPNGTDSFLFAGHERDAGVASDYFKARFYAPFAERFTSPDPLSVTEARIATPFRLNRYAYANLNPFRFTDATGLDVSEDPNWWRCPGWLVVDGCSWNEGLLGFDSDGYLTDGFEPPGSATFLTRRASAPIGLTDIMAMRDGITPPGEQPIYCRSDVIALMTLADDRTRSSGWEYGFYLLGTPDSYVSSGVTTSMSSQRWTYQVNGRSMWFASFHTHPKGEWWASSGDKSIVDEELKKGHPLEYFMLGSRGLGLYDGSKRPKGEEVKDNSILLRPGYTWKSNVRATEGVVCGDVPPASRTAPVFEGEANEIR